MKPHVVIMIAASALLSPTVMADPITRVVTIHTGFVNEIEDQGTFGLFNVRPDEEVDFRFIVDNAGDGVLSIIRVDAAFDVPFPSRGFGFSSNGDGIVGRVNFRPDQLGPFNIEVTVITTAPDSPFEFTLEGVVRAPVITLSHEGQFVSEEAPLQLPSVIEEQSVTVVVDAKNAGNRSISLREEAIVEELTGMGSAQEISVTVPDRIDPDTISEIAVEFRPAGPGTRTFLVTLESQDLEDRIDFVIDAEGLPKFADCNGNGFDDLEDIAEGASTDCDRDSRPDECQPDADGDAVIDPCDLCPGDDDLFDFDGDGIPDCRDNCPDVPNLDQSDGDGDGVGDECDPDGNGDDEDRNGGEDDEIQDCNTNGFDDRSDIDEGFSEDCNANGVPDECEPDSDNDSVIDACDRCPGEDDLSDADLDNIAECLDNCPGVFNPAQVDSDGDDIGDACDDAIEPNDREPGDEEVDVTRDDPAVDDEDGGVADRDVTEPVDDNGPDDGAAPDEPQASEIAGNFCGAGLAAILPLTMLGLIGSRRSTGYRRSEA